jgi:hypothetical protein
MATNLSKANAKKAIPYARHECRPAVDPQYELIVRFQRDQYIAVIQEERQDEILMEGPPEIYLKDALEELLRDLGRLVNKKFVENDALSIGEDGNYLPGGSRVLV